MKISLVHNSGKHNKFWTAHLNDDHSVLTEWGRLGTKGQNKTFEFGSDWEARNFIDKKAHEKQRKGYREFSDIEVATLQLQAEIVGSECKVAELCFIQGTPDPTVHFPGRAKRPNEGDFKMLKNDDPILCSPEYRPVIFAILRLTQRQAVGELCFNVYINEEKVYLCKHNLTTTNVNGTWFRLGGFTEITDSDDSVLQKVRDKAPSIVQALISAPASI